MRKDSKTRSLDSTGKVSLLAILLVAGCELETTDDEYDIIGDDIASIDTTDMSEEALSTSDDEPSASDDSLLERVAFDVFVRRATAARYAPLVFLARNEKYLPMNASSFINNSELDWSHDDGCGDHDPVAERGKVSAKSLGQGKYTDRVESSLLDVPPCEAHGREIHSNENVRPLDGEGDGGNEGFFLNLDNSKREGQGVNAYVYYEARDRHFITYWFLYGYNEGPFGGIGGVGGAVDNHEGDWERISIKLDQHNHATAVAYYQHDKPPHEISWRDVPKHGSHPNVFSAKGSHASYASPGKHFVRSEAGIDIYDHASAGQQWKTWNHLTKARKQNWYGYGGAWGEVGDIELSTGPQGPSHKKPAPDNF